MRVRSLSVVLFLSVACSGCSIGTTKLYPGPTLPDTELSFVDNSKNAIQVRAVDSQKAFIGTWWEQSGGAKESAAMLPGKHVFDVVCKPWPGAYVIAVLSADLKAGHRYSLDTNWIKIPAKATVKGELPNVRMKEGARVYVMPYIFDRANGQVISSVVSLQTQQH